MCTVSDKIILCTCATKDVHQLKHYWVLFRHDISKGEPLIGETIGWESFLQRKDPHNPVLLCNKLNEGHLFDIPLDFEDKDRLLISFLFSGNTENVNYGFAYKAGSWRVIDYDFFDWNIEHSEFKEGKIKNAISTK